MAHELGLPIGRYLRETTRRQHLAWLAWLDDQLNVPSRSDWHVIRNGWWQLDPEKRPPLHELGHMFGPKDDPTAEGPFPRWTKESIARAKAQIRRAELRRHREQHGRRNRT